ncbi:MAG: D-aminoacylase [Desulfurococcaceae archaeon]
MVTRFDLIIKNGIVVDGSGSPPFRADIGILGDRIWKIGNLAGSEADIVIDAKGLMISPGFIDIHNHSDISLLELPTADNYVLQGVTTIVIGNCGYSPAPLTDLNRDEIIREVKNIHPDVQITWSTFNEYLNTLEKTKPSINVVPLVGHGTIRSAVLGFADTVASERDISLMKSLVEEAMRSGAFGISTGLIYVPGMFSDRKEIIELAKIAAIYQGIYFTHMRNEGVGLVDSVIEALEIGLNSGLGVEISHLKACGRPNWGKVKTVLDLISEYAYKGHDVSADAYPYEAWSTSLTTLLPSDYRKGSASEILEKLLNPNAIYDIMNKQSDLAIEEGYISWHDIEISFSLRHKEWEGMRLSQIAEKLGIDPVEVMVKLLIEDELLTEIVGFTISPTDVESVISHPLVAIGSDGSIYRKGMGKPHPRSYGTFPRVIAKFVREKKVISLPEAIRKMTLLPARKLGIWDRGLIRPGFKADLVIFDYYAINDTATYNNPHSYPTGIKWVIVNGEIVAENGKVLTSARPGSVLRKTAQFLKEL